jgi:small subunit ribosomal protein S5
MTTDTTTTKKETTGAGAPDAAARPARGGRGGRGDARGAGRGGPRRGGDRNSDARRSEYDQKLADIRRVSRTVAGGRRFSFSVTMIIGDRKGKVGVGLGKGGDTALAIEKAMRDAKKHMITVVRTKTNSIPHNVRAKYAASVIEIRPAAGKGLVAGASARTILEFAGVTDVTTKILSRSKNPLTIARATIRALKQLSA